MGDRATVARFGNSRVSDYLARVELAPLRLIDRLVWLIA
jgi:hypothetical protein